MRAIRRGAALAFALALALPAGVDAAAESLPPNLTGNWCGQDKAAGSVLRVGHATQVDYSSGDILKIRGIITIVFSVVMGAMSFALPSRCSVVASLMFLLSATFLVGGIIAWAIGKLKTRKQSS